MKKIVSLFLIYIGLNLNAYSNDLRFVQVSNVNYSKNGNNDIFINLVKDINAQKDVQFVVFSGNNINNPDIENLKGFIKEAKKLKKPFYVVIGNKDVNKHKDLSKKQYIAYLRKHLVNNKAKNTNYIFKRNDVIFFAVDGAKDVIPSSTGYYKDDVLEWVDAHLDLYPNKNIIILQHFPLITENENDMQTFKPEKYLEIINKHSNVKAVISSHPKENSEKTVNNVIHINTAPIPYYRIIDILDCDTKNPSIWAEVKTVE